MSPILISEFQVSTTGIYQSKSIALSRPGIFIQDYFSKKQKLPLNPKLLLQKTPEERFSKVGVSS